MLSLWNVIASDCDFELLFPGRKADLSAACGSPQDLLALVMPDR